MPARKDGDRREKCLAREAFGRLPAGAGAWRGDKFWQSRQILSLQRPGCGVGRTTPTACPPRKRNMGCQPGGSVILRRAVTKALIAHEVRDAVFWGESDKADVNGRERLKDKGRRQFHALAFCLEVFAPKFLEFHSVCPAA